MDIDRCNRITDLAPLAAMRGLRSVRLEMRDPPSLEPFVGHPALEYLWLLSARRPPAQVTEALLGLPRLRFLPTARAFWIRPDAEWLPIADIYAMTEEQTALYERVLREQAEIAAW